MLWLLLSSWEEYDEAVLISSIEEDDETELILLMEGLSLSKTAFSLEEGSGDAGDTVSCGGEDTLGVLGVTLSTLYGTSENQCMAKDLVYQMVLMKEDPLVHRTVKSKEKRMESLTGVSRVLLLERRSRILLS